MGLAGVAHPTWLVGPPIGAAQERVLEQACPAILGMFLGEIDLRVYGSWLPGGLLTACAARARHRHRGGGQAGAAV